MSVLQVGRFGLDSDVDVGTFAVQGDGARVTITGEIESSSVTIAKVLRQQLGGHVDNQDEPFVPVTWSEDSTVDGFIPGR
jgi:hypothetical protein